ncbi:hypothetical protein F4861DRAFT_526523 [Xylaria intraflava]|nr:hypothetical protein F4861DRAFT_526523 [Xylaria intraflava]
MALLRSKLPHKHTSTGVDTSASQRRTKRKPPKRKHKSSQAKKASINRVPTPLAERKNEEDHQHPEKKLALRSRTGIQNGQSGGYNGPWIQEVPLKRNNGKTKKTIVKRRHFWNRLDQETISPPLKERRLEDEFPMIIECWQ